MPNQNEVERIRLFHHMSKEVLEVLLKTNLDINGILEILRVYTSFDIIEIYLKDRDEDLDWDKSLPEQLFKPEYLSKAIIKINNIGIIYIADKQANFFNMSIIEIFENISSNIYISMMCKKAEKEKQDLLESLIYKNHLLESFKTISHLLLECDEVSVLNQILQIVGETLSVSRVYLFETSPLDKNNYILNNCDWSLLITDHEEKYREGNDYPDEKL